VLRVASLGINNLPKPTQQSLAELFGALPELLQEILQELLDQNLSAKSASSPHGACASRYTFNSELFNLAGPLLVPRLVSCIHTGLTRGQALRVLMHWRMVVKPCELVDRLLQRGWSGYDGNGYDQLVPVHLTHSAPVTSAVLQLHVLACRIAVS